MGVITTGTITFLLVCLNVGFGVTFLTVWIRAWELAYLIVVPLVLMMAPALQRLITKLFTSTKGADHVSGGIRVLQQRIAFALLMGVITTGVISFAVILRTFGYKEDFALLWLRAWGLGYAVVIPLLLIVAPTVQRFVSWCTTPRS
jgi:hypothetical protein